jgi:hypothetical protein
MNSYSICHGCSSPLLVIILVCWTKAAPKFATPERKIERGSKQPIGYNRCQLHFGSYTVSFNTTLYIHSFNCKMLKIFWGSIPQSGSQNHTIADGSWSVDDACYTEE